MSYVPQTPPKALPGTYIQTPAVNRFQASTVSQPAFRTLPAPMQQQQNGSQPSTQANSNQSQQLQPQMRYPAEDLKPIERAARNINQTLNQESQYPNLDSYVGQGVSSEYDVSTQSAWAPFQKAKMYAIPDKVFEQYNRAQVSTMMGLFADVNHAWVSIDNALYIWDYTLPNADLIGFEEQNNTITAVKLVVPKAGVFRPQINRLLVVATTAEIIIVGVSTEPAPTGGLSLALYKTGLVVAVRGIDVTAIEGSPTSGRIFFAGRSSDDLYEVVYKQDEGWFQQRCVKVNHTSRGISAFVPSSPFGSKPQQEHVVQIIADDSRRLLYTLSSRSSIRTFHMTSNGGLNLVITKPLDQVLNNIAHMTSQSDLISTRMQIVSIYPISSQEASKIHLMATTSTGCRIFMSATSSYGWGSFTDSANAPSNMQVQHVKFPPPDTAPQQYEQQQRSTQMTTYNNNQGLNTSSRALVQTRSAYRYAPGFLFAFVSKGPQAQTDSLFISAPDSARIARPQDPSRLSKYAELGLWLNLGSCAEDVGLASVPFSAASSPVGFGNELAVQYDKPASEVAILTNTGIHMLRRRRLVDMFASTIRTGGGDEGLEGETKRFIRLYGRGETASTALAVACGQGVDVTSDLRLARVTDPEVLEYARKAFIDFGGKPQYNENSVMDKSTPAIDLVRPSPRHEGLSLYVSRLVRSIWKAPVAREMVTPTGGLSVLPAVSLSKLRDIQGDLSKLKEFLDTNKSFIEGLAGPAALGRVSSKQEEITLQAEHRALHALVVLIDHMIEGISFVLVLFDERIEEIVLSLPNDTRQQVRSLSYETLFSAQTGRDLAKELVKAIVNRNIANGSNVEAVAEALRRRCGSFCSADDVKIFKAQELVKRASEAGSDSEFGRNLLNESLSLFKQVVSSLSMEQLQWAVQQYVSMQFYAGAIQLSLNVAQESDRGNRALTWIQEGRPDKDSRAAVFEQRKQCYNLIHEVIKCLEQASAQAPDMIEGQYTAAAKRRKEAYEVIDSSEDEVFQTDLYDWYLAQGQTDRLLEIQSPYIVTYLQRKSSDEISHADLLWRYYMQSERYHDAAGVQLALAKSAFTLPLDRRIEYLSRAKANASTHVLGGSRQTRQVLLREISDLLDVANIQDDLLQLLRSDDRITPQRKPDIVKSLNDQIISLSELYNSYADQASYFDICILIYQAADHRNPSDIKTTWQNLLERIHEDAAAKGQSQPYEAVSQKVRSLGNRLNLSETMFPIPDLVPMLKRYAYEFQNDVAPETWVMDTFIDVQVPYESMVSVLEGMFYNEEAPFQGRNRRYIANDLIYVISLWFRETSRGAEAVFGGESNAEGVSQLLQVLMQGGLDEPRAQQCQALRLRIEHTLR